MKMPMHGFLSAWSMLSRVPVRLGREPDYSQAGFWMPIVGLGAAAAACAGAGLGLLAFGPGLMSAMCAMVPQYLGFNLFHLDGLLDSADAAGASGGVEDRRAVLKDPRIGSFALFAGFVALSGRLGAVSSLLTGGSAAAWGALALAPVAGRFAAALVPSMAEPYGSGGLASALGRPSPAFSTTGYAIAAVPGTLLFGIAYGAVGAMASILAGGLVAIAVSYATGAWYRARLGGYSGDAMGTAVELAELAVLAIAAAIAR
ncbi:MAG: hypothetical protein CVV51_04680 [Spirochaetae bacterium HGW-Spirochaetae-7]|jgi:adenosylcobinamide-GDP ribazoletransferase|nr:MAG: hypothetical protein CVV51_04680 [Spirochaetae bacterium HGW-Spirochaetae-7]